MEPHEKLIGEAVEAARAAMAERPFRSQPSYDDVLAMIEAAVGYVVAATFTPYNPPRTSSEPDPILGGEGSGDSGSSGGEAA